MNKIKDRLHKPRRQENKHICEILFLNINQQLKSAIFRLNDSSRDGINIQRITKRRRTIRKR